MPRPILTRRGARQGMEVFWGEVGIPDAAPGAHRPPAPPFGLQDPADLAAAHGDALGLGGRSQGVQGPLRRLVGLLRPVKAKRAVRLAQQPPGRVAGNQGDELAALQLPKPPGPARAGQVAKVIEAASVEAVQLAVDGRGVAAELGGDLADLGAIPAQGDARAAASSQAHVWRERAGQSGAPRRGRPAGRTAAAA
jgi:hypothetical protein